MPDRKQREARRAAGPRDRGKPGALRRSIAESQRLIDEAAKMTRRHRREIEDDKRR